MNKRKVLFLVGAIVVLAAAGLYGVKTTYETNVRNAIERFFASLPEPLKAKAEKIDVAFFSKSVTITGLTVSAQTEDGQHDFSAAEITASGINPEAVKEGAGKTRLARTLEVKNYLYASKDITVKAERETYKNIDADFGLLVTEGAKALPVFFRSGPTPASPLPKREEMRIFTDLAPFMAAAETISIAEYSAMNYVYVIPTGKGETTITTVAKSSMKDYSLRATGPVALSGIACAPVGSSPGVRIESMGWDSAKLPSFVPMFKALGKDESPEAVIETMKGQDFALRNLYVKNLSVHKKEDVEETLFSLKDFSFSYIAEAVHELAIRYDSLDVDKKILAKGKALPPAALNLLPETLSYSGVTRISASKSEHSNIYAVDCDEMTFREKKLGAFTLRFAVRDIDPAVVVQTGDPGPAVLKSFALSITDTGVSDIIFASLAQQEGSTPETMRARTLGEFPPPAAIPNEVQRELIDAIRSFTASSGNTLAIALAPATPLTFRALQEAALLNPRALGLSASTTLAQ